MNFRRKVERAGMTGSLKIKLLEDANEKITVELLTQRLRSLVQQIEGKELGSSELHELTIYCHNQTAAAKTLQADALIQAWEDMGVAVESTYRANNIGIIASPGNKDVM